MSLRCFVYNFDVHHSLLTIFGRDATVKVSNQKMLYFPTSHD